MEFRRRLFEKSIVKSCRPGDKIFIDFDGTMCDTFYEKGDDIPIQNPEKSLPVPGAIEVIKELSKVYDLYILTGDSGMWKGGLTPNKGRGMNWKPEWVVKYFGPPSSNIFTKKMIYCSHKELLIEAGAYLIDDTDISRTGTDIWSKRGKLIQFGSSQFPDWEAIRDFLL